MADASNHTRKTAVIAGAGPAGLTAALQLLKETDIHPVVFEADDVVGGISRTVKYKGNRMDIGGHRFFSKSKEITDWWLGIMQMQGGRSHDDILLALNDKPLHKGGPDPEKNDRVMLFRHRVSRIFFLRKFFDYPISLKKDTFANMGFFRMMRSGAGYLWSCIHKLPETSLENFYINRFGKPLYEMFFEDYTEKVWGIHPSKLGADWGSQRVKGLSVWAILKNMARKYTGRKDKEVETSLIEQFLYPKLGPGQLWETVADEIRQLGGEIYCNCSVEQIRISDGIVKEVRIKEKNGETRSMECDYFLSSMPIKDLVSSIDADNVPQNVKEIASTLPYRDFITVGLCVKELSIKNSTAIRTYRERIPDTWIYIQERDVKLGRLQIFNNWSPYLVADYENTMWIGLEYFCSEGDDMWTMESEEFINMAVGELEKIGIIKKEDVLDACRVKVRKAYPAYFGSYYRLNEVRDYLDGISNLFCIGRNGQHRYNNMDHSMMTAIQSVRNIAAGITDKTAVWNVNTETEYHESRQN